MNKAYDTALTLAESLEFVQGFCEKSDCGDCIFGVDDECCLKSDPVHWDINAVMLNIGVRLGKEKQA